MATVADPKSSPASKYDTRLHSEIDKATSRIRVNDALAGAALLAVLVLAYVVVGVLLDRWLELPQWVRILGFGGFALVFATTAYRTVVTPLRAAVNPRFAARQIEATAPGVKNAVINWVDLREQALPDVIRAAVALKAADGLAGADVQKATESRRLVWLGSAAGLLMATLAVLLVLCKPTQFFSLLGRTINPFASTRIASRTAITLTTPTAGDTTITTGDMLTVAVGIAGSVPDPNGPDRVRLQFRHSQEAAEYEEMPMVVASDNGRDFTLQVPVHIVQNGFWYRVAAGDAATTEYRVTVRSRPTFKSFEAKYEYPAYLRMKPDVGTEPALEAYRGTTVTLTAKTNREVKSGRMLIHGKPDAEVGKVVGEGKDSLQFRITLTEPGTYQLVFTSAADEPSGLTPSYPITVLTDCPPTVEMTDPKEQELALPSNGLLKVAGTVGDDFGIDTVILKMRVIPFGKDPSPIPTEKKFQDRSFRRDADGSFPTSLEYKDSVSLAGLKDMLGKPVPVKAKDVIELWIEATDNCTVPAANVGKSKVYRVTLDEPAKGSEPVERQKQEAAVRNQEEKQLNDQQNRRLNTEKRDPPQQRHQDANTDSKAGEQQAGDPGAAQQQPGDQSGKPNAEAKAGDRQPQSNEKGQPGSKDNGTPQAGGTELATQEPGQEQGTDPKSGSPKSGQPDTKQPDDNELQEQANRVQDAMKNQERQPGQARGNDAGKPDEQPTPAGEKNTGGKPPADAAAEPKPGEQKPNGDQPKAGDQSAGSKGPGQIEPPAGSDTKPEAKQPAGGPDDPERQPTGDTSKNEPKKGRDSGQEKGTSEKPTPQQGGNPKPDAGQGRGADPSETKTLDANKPGEAPKNGAKPKPEPEAGTSKPKPNPERGDERATPDEDPKDGTPGHDQQPAEGKGDKPTPGGKSKPRPGSEDPSNGGKPSPSDDKPKPPNQDTATEKPNPGDRSGQPHADQPDSGQGQPGEEKPSDDDASQNELEPSELEREFSRKGKKVPPPQEAVERLTRKANDLADANQQKRKEAEKKFDDLLGKKDREKLQQAEKDKQNGSNPAKQEQVQKDVDELTKKAAQKEQDRERAKDLAKQAGDLVSGNPDKRKAAEKNFDEAVGQEKREKIQDAMNDMKSGDPKRQQAGRENLKNMANNTDGKSSEGRQPSEEEMKDLADTAKDLNSPDPSKRKAAEQKLDEKIGKEKREQAEQLAKDLKSPNPDTRKAAQEKLKDMAEQAHGGKQGGEKSPNQKNAAPTEKDREDLASDDEKVRKPAEEKFDKALGEQGRKELQQATKDKKTGTPEQRKAAKEKADDLMKDAAKAGKPNDKNSGDDGRKPSREEMERLAKEAQDLASPDEAKRKAAEKKFDQMMGKDEREKLQQNAKDLQSDDPEKQKAAAERIKNDLAKHQGNEKDKGEEAARPSKEEADKLVQKAKDLQSNDPKKREAVEKELKDFAEKMDKDKKEQFEEAMKDAESKNPKKAAEGQRKLEEMAQNAAKNRDPSDTAGEPGPEFRPGGGPGGRTQEGKPIDGDPKSRLKSAELQLSQLEKARYNDEIKKKLGYSDQEYEAFLKAYQERVEQMRQEADNAARQPDTPRPAGLPNLRVGETGNAEFRADPTVNTTGAVGVGTAPPGFSDAKRKFAEEAAKLRPKK